MGFIQKLVNRVPVFFVVLGLVMLTGSYRGHEYAGGPSPVTGGALLVLGAVSYGGIKYAGW